MGSARTAAIEQLVRLLDAARPMPFVRNRVRVDKSDADALLDIILESNHDDEIAVGGADLVAAAKRLRDALQGAYPVPLTDQVRLSPGLIRELADALRIAAGNGA